MKRYLPGALIILFPMIGGLLMSWLLEIDLLPNPLISGTFQVDLAGIIARAGLVASLLAAGVVVLIWWAQHRVNLAREAERRIQASSRRQFLRRLDHELKNPLTIIRVGVVNLQQGKNLTADESASLERIGLQADRLQRLVGDLRWLAGLEQHTLERRAVDLNEVLQEVVGMANDLPEYQGHTVSLEIQEVPWPLSTVWGDRDMLAAALQNLLDNALKYTAPTGQVQVRAMEDGNAVVVEVADTGPGIPPEDIPYIFDELYRGANSRSVAGSGLGLALVHRIVTLHGGTVSVRSRVGQGTVLTVRLPLTAE